MACRFRERYRQALAPFDKDNDGRITIAEVDQMPALMRHRVREVVLQRFGEQ